MGKQNGTVNEHPVSTISNGKTMANGKTMDGFPETAALRSNEITPREKENSKSSQWKEAWFNFTQNTTLHGVNYITGETPFPIRRVIWFLIVSLGIALFARQVVESVLYYWSWPVTVNVKINYNKTITFPAVTICNQNDFRATATANLSKYHLVTDYYSNLEKHSITNLTEKEGNLSLSTLYYEAAHRMEDMIMDCRWDETKCNLTEFERQLTDYGVCYTFNMEQGNRTLRKVSRTGADRGLRLHLNIEQYEYMHGPNPGAGIKLLVHDNQEVPLVRDLGVAIPPGTHAYVGVQITEIKNLKEPHGQCNDSVKLKYYKSYSVPACVVECKEDFMVENCHCRDVYMQSEDDDNPPICRLEEYQSCALPKMEEFYDDKDRCDCPIPCRRLLFDTSISYAYASSHDINFFLSEDLTELRESYLLARETVERKKFILRDENIRLINAFGATVDNFTQALAKVTTDLTNAGIMLSLKLTQFRKRLWFHKRWGLEKVKYVMEYDFVRGWEVFNERTLDGVTTGYQEITAYLEHVAEIVNRGTADEYTLSALAVQVDRLLYEKKILCTRAHDNVTEAQNAYENAEPILDYEGSPGRRYDDTWVTPLVVQASSYFKSKYFDKMLLRTRQFFNETEALEAIMANVKTGGPIDVASLKATNVQFEKRARSYNYYKYVLEQRVISAPVEYAEKATERFEDLNTTLTRRYDDFEFKYTSLMNFLDQVTESWSRIQQAREQAELYLADLTQRKTALAKHLTSKGLNNDLETVNEFLAQVTTRSHDLLEAVQAFERSYNKVWSNMLSEESLKDFYALVADDWEMAGQNDTFMEYWDGKAAYMIEEKAAWVKSNMRDVIWRMNADFSNTTIEQQSQANRAFIATLQPLFDVSECLETGQKFFKSMSNLTENMNKFLVENELDSEYYRNNFLTLDVFMKELSYEEVQQQAAYDLTSLWSDVGGSIGLCIGASIITVFELVDVIIHNFFRLHVCSSRAKKKGEPEKEYL